MSRVPRSVDEAAGPVRSPGTTHHGPSTPEVLHPSADCRPTQTEPAAAAARISSVAKSAAAAGIAAAREGVMKLQHSVQHAVASPAGPFGDRSPHEISTDGEEGVASVPVHAHMGHRLCSDSGLAGLADAAGHAWHVLPDLGQWRKRVQLVQLAAGLLLAGTLGYAFLFAPNHLGLRRDLSMLSRFFNDNAIAFVLFNLLGLFPFIINCLMWPTVRSRGLKPAMWPHLALSYVAGAFALLSYLVRWRPPSPRRAAKMPLTRLTGDHLWLQRLHESRLAPAVMTASITTLLALCLAATPATWAHFGFMARHSKAIHVMLLDLTLLTLMSPWLVVTDARARGVSMAQSTAGAALLGLSMLLAPLVGPGVYLLMRPVTQSQGSGLRGRRPVGLISWLVHARQTIWPTRAGAAAGPAQVRAAARDRAVRGRAARDAHQLRNSADAAMGHAGSSAAAAGRTSAANVAAAASVPLPSARDAEETAAQVAGYATGTVWGGLLRGWTQVKRGANRFLSGGYPQLATAARTGSADEVFIEYPGHDAGTDSSESTDHQHGEEGQAFPVHNALGSSAYFITSVTPGGGRELLFADDYNETEAKEGYGSDEEDDAIGTESSDEEDEFAQGGVFADSDADEEGDVTFDMAADDEEAGDEQQQGLRRGGYRAAKAACLQKLAELAHFEHPHTA